MASGFIYIMSNPSFSDSNLLKVGRTDRHPEERAKELNGTSTPVPFIVEFFSPCTNPVLAESVLHGWLHRYRENHNREFFRVKLDRAIALAVRACQQAEMMSLHDAIGSVLREAEKTEEASAVKQSAPGWFVPEGFPYEMGPDFGKPKQEDGDMAARKGSERAGFRGDNGRRLIAFVPGLEEYAYRGNIDIVEAPNPEVAKILRSVRQAPKDASIRDLCKATGRTPGGRQAARIKRIIKEHAPRMYRDRFGG